MSTRALIVECTWCTNLVLKFENKDQTEDEDEVQVLVMIGDHLVERKGFKE
jgi:hypothetical protein